MNRSRAEDRSTSRFVLYTTQRSGSSWVRRMLGSHPQVEAFGELFLPRSNPYVRRCIAEARLRDPHWGVAWSRIGRGWRRLVRPRYVFRHLDRVLVPTHDATRTVGFKLMYDQSVRHPEVLGYLARRRVGIVHLVRRNYLDVILSDEASRARGAMHATTDVEQVQVHLDAPSLLRRLRRRERATRWASRIVHSLPVPSVQVDYESLAADSGRFEDVMAFLGVERDPSTLRSDLLKLNRAPHWELISNYGAVRQTLAATRFAHLLHVPGDSL